MTQKTDEANPPSDQIAIGSVIDDFEIMEQIGSGAFSHVHIAKHRSTGCFCAAKVVNLTAMKPDEFIGIMREVSVFMQVDHPNIANLYRLSLSTSERIEELVFFMEYASRGTLLEYVNSKGGLSEFEAQRLFIQIFAGLRHLHIYHFLVHRDLKLENILIDAKGNMKLTDFGLASTYYNNTLRTFVGTAGYQPPEIIAGNEYDEKCDVWSLGVCLYAMITGCLPFSTQNNNFRALIQEAQDMIFPKNFSPMLIDLLKKMFDVRPSSRPTLIQLQSHPWLKGLQQLGTNVAPQPVMFYKVTNSAMISKFKRRTFKADAQLLEKCLTVSPTFDKAKTSDNLLKGITDNDTTIYFCTMRPLLEKPPLPQPPKPKVPIIPGSRQRKLSLNPANNNNKNDNDDDLEEIAAMQKTMQKVDKGETRPRKGSVPTFSKTSKATPVVVTPQQPNMVHLGLGRPGSNKSNPIMSSTNKLLRVPLGSSQAKRKPL